jgi:hypothetical protein
LLLRARLRRRLVDVRERSASRSPLIRTERKRTQVPSRTARRAATALLLGGIVVLALALHRHEPLQHWLFFRYARAVLLAATFSLTCLVAGHAALLRVLGRTLPFEEHVSLAFALGVLAFFLTSFAFGIVGLYGPAFFFGGPALLLALGVRPFLATLARVRRRWGKWDHGLRLDALRALCLLYGAVGVLYVWFTILTPQNASFDARWYHLPIAEIYVAQGGIAPFSEGWVPGAFPQLASLIYAWAFCMSGSMFDRVVTAAHLEFAVFSMTLFGVVAIVRRVLGKRSPLAWVALFLFPGIFCYDSSLLLGADHVAAVFAPPLFLVSLRYLAEPTRAHAVLLGALVAGVLDTKYSAATLVLLPVAVVVSAAVRDLKAKRGRRAAMAAAVTFGTTVVLTAPHWLKNAVFYGDPLFPSLRQWLPAHPWHVAAEAPHPTWFSLHHPPLGAKSVLETLTTLATFSFLPHDFPQFHGDVPVFGFLFTLVTPLAFLFPRRPRLTWLFVGTYLGVAGWFWIHQFDRYLQVLVPWMAAATAVVLTLVWRMGGAARLATSLLVVLQGVWGAAVPFIPSHRTAGAPISKVVIDLLGRGYRGESASELMAYPEWEAVGRALPRGSKLLVHEEENRAGLSVASAVDYSGDQGAFYWGEPGASSPAEIHRLLRSHGITHVLWAKNLDHGTDTVAAGLVFFDFVSHHTDVLGSFGGYVLAALRAPAPPDVDPRWVAYYPCEVARSASPPDDWDPVWAPRGLNWPIFSQGLYRLSDMARAPGDARPLARPAPDVSMAEAFERAHFVVFDARCHGALPESTRKRFELLASRGHAMMLVRKSAP